MRRALLLLLLGLASACTQAPPPQTAAKAPLAPLGACKPSSWKPEAPPPVASTKESMALLAVQEWARFGGETIRFPASGKEQIERVALPEGDAFVSPRVHDYWLAVDRPTLSGTDHDEPWSAAFISWDIQSAGVPRDLFCPDARHTIYIERIAMRAKEPGAAFIPHHLGDYRPKPGDLICASRAGGTTTLENLDRGPGHCDIVVAVQPGEVWAIGGNVHDTVTRSVFPLDGQGFLSPISARNFFTVIENRLP
jgi:hypothetical protein